jgi:hypothetical protein
MAGALLGGKEKTLFKLQFDLPHQRPAHLQVSVNRQGVGSYVELLLYTVKLSKPLFGEVALEDAKFFGKSKFAGDAAACGKLSANGELIKRANNLARVESQSGGPTLKIKRCCKVVLHEGCSMLIAGTLPRHVKMRFGAAIDAKDFFDIADMVEASL